MIVVDACTFVASVMDDEVDEKAREICNLIVGSDEVAIVPSLFYYEVANVILKALRRKRIMPEQYKSHLSLLLDFPLVVDDKTPVFEIAVLAEKHELSFYDAAYLELAGRENCSLATLDRKLIEAAKKSCITLVL